MFTQVIIPFVLMSKMIPTKKKTTKKTVLEDTSLSFHSCVALRFLLQAVWKTRPGGLTGVLKMVSEHGAEGAGVWHGHVCMKHRWATQRCMSPPSKDVMATARWGDCQRWKLCSHSCPAFFLVAEEYIRIEQCFCCEGKAQKGSRQTSMAQEQHHTIHRHSCGGTASAWALSSKQRAVMAAFNPPCFHREDQCHL